MCLVVLGLGVDPATPFVLAANRDELYERPSAPAGSWADAPRVFGGRDLLSGGTWLGVTRQGRFAALTNVRDPSRNRKDARSRGELVSGFLLGDQSREDYLLEVSRRAGAYNPFNLLVGDLLGRPPAVSFYGTESGEIRALPGGVHGVSNGDLDEPWPKVVRAKAALEADRRDRESLLSFLLDRSRAPDADLPDTGVGLDLERLLSPVFNREPAVRDPGVHGALGLDGRSALPHRGDPRGRAAFGLPRGPGARARLRVRERVAVGIALLLWAAGILTAALVAMRQPFWGLDYLSIWGLKARAIEGSHELASVFRVDPLGDYAHPHYPPLWPLLLAGASRLLGGLDDLALTPLWPLLVLSASLLAARATRGPLLARILAGAVVSLLPYFRVPAYPGYADALLAVLVLGAVAELPTLDRTASLARFSAFLVLATLTKSEGVVLAASAVGVLGLARAVRSAVVAGAAVVVLGVLPWALYQRAHAAPEAKTAFSAAAFSVSRIGDVLVGVARTPLPLGSVLLVLGLALVALAPATRRARSGPLLCGALYLVALLGSFLFSRFDAAWHVAYSWDRLVFVVTAGLVPVFVEAGAEATLPRTG